LNVQQEINPPDITDKIHELQNSVASKRSENKVNKKQLNDLRQHVNILQEEFDKDLMTTVQMRL
jgi:hypothetical protein